MHYAQVRLYDVWKQICQSKKLGREPQKFATFFDKNTPFQKDKNRYDRDR